MEADLKYQLETRTAPDPEFYSAILRRLVLHKAKARLREMHATLRAQSLAAAEAGLDVPASLGWRQEVPQFPLFFPHISTVFWFPSLVARCFCPSRSSNVEVAFLAAFGWMGKATLLHAMKAISQMCTQCVLDNLLTVGGMAF